FREVYGLEGAPSQLYPITQYAVGLRQNLKLVREKPRGAPERVESWVNTVYTERAANVTKLGDVIAAIRRYDSFDQGPKAPNSPNPALFQGLTVWVTRGKGGSLPQILSLTNDRPLRESEYNAMISQVSLPPLKALLPNSPRRVGDTWRVPREAAAYLFG